MRRRFALLFTTALGSSALAACVDAVSSEPDGGVAIEGVTGGQESDAAASLTVQQPPGPPFNYAPLTPGNTWSALYTDYFSAPRPADGGGFTGGRAACSGTAGGCHGSATGAGAVGSEGYVCAGDDSDAGKDTCYMSLTTNPLMLLVPAMPFTADLLYQGVLNSTANHHAGNMPLGAPEGGANTLAYPSAYVFNDADIQRLSAWVDAGFPNN